MLKGYGEYKEISLPWLKSIPRNWTSLKIGELFEERKIKVSDKEYAPLTVGKMGIVPQLSTVAKSNDSDNRKLVKSGDYVINSRSDRRGSSGLSFYDGSVSLINIVLIPRKGNGRYYHYLLRSHYWIEEYYRNGRGIVADLWTTRFSEMKSITLPVPPRSEQGRIVQYLDWKVSLIDKYVSTKKKQIELLKERKQAIINQAVTKGLDPKVPLKDSGTPSIGYIPNNWNVCSFLKIAEVKANLVHPEKHLNLFQVSSANIEKNTGKLMGYQTVKQSGIISDNHYFYKGQILYSKIRPLLNKVTIAPFDGLCSADIYPIETLLDTEYLKYFMLSQAFLSQLSMTNRRVKMPKINKEELSKIFIPFPSENEQQSVVKFILAKFQKIDIMIDNLSNIVILLNEYRTHLISDVVIGKVNVQNEKTPNFEVYKDDRSCDDREDVSRNE
jgi:type I restriction enzyme S subunit